jgi:hypothetical protein
VAVPEKSSWFKSIPFGIVFWVVVAGALAWFGFAVCEAGRALRIRHWAEVPCLILQSRVAERSTSHGTDYTLAVRFRYSVGGKTYESDRKSNVADVYSDDFGKVQAQALRLLAGTTTTCRVDPAHPSVAFLQAGIDYPGLIIPWAFVFIIGLIQRQEIMQWISARGERKALQQSRPLSELYNIRKLSRKSLLIGLVGLLMTSAFAVVFWVVPLWNLHKARNWVPVPCTIIRRDVKGQTHHQGGRSYHPDILYQYVFDGQEYRSSNFDLSWGMDVNHAKMVQRLAPFAPGTSTVCYVNPAEPTSAVLRRSFDPDLFFTLFGGGMFLISFICIGSAVTQRLKWQRAHIVALKTPIDDRRTWRPRRDNLLKALGCVIASLGVIALAVYLLPPAIESLRAAGEIDLIPLLYGIVAAVGAIWFLSKARGFVRIWRAPFPVVRLSPASPIIGQTLRLQWEFANASATATLQEFEVLLEGWEKAKYSVSIPTPHGPEGQDKTSQWQFFSAPIVECEGSPAVRSEVFLSVPQRLMHSFDAGRSAVEWRLCVALVTRRGRRVENTCTICLRAPPVKSHSHG